jgi:tetratricopeptide (TPR) repeat protein
VFFLLPYKIERKFRSFPWVTVALIAWFTSLFLHAGLIHLLGNMYFLWLFGSMALYRLVARGGAMEQSLEPQSLQAVASAAESQHEYELAERAYGTLLVAHPQSGEAERALFRLAHVYQARGMLEEARQTWRAFAESYPQSAWMPYADAGLMAG